MLYKKAKKIEQGKFEIRSNEIYKNSNVEIFSNEGISYVVEASLFRGVKSERRFRLNLKDFLLKNRPFLYIVEKVDAEKVNLVQIKEEKAIRNVLFNEARKDRGIEFLSAISYFPNTPKPKPRAPGFENRDVINLKDYSSYWI